MKKNGNCFSFQKSFYLKFFAYSVFFVISLLYFSFVLSGKEILIERDLSVFFIPPKYLWVNLIKTFQMPLWNPYNYSGIPLLATLQPGVFYPPNFIYILFPFNLVWNWLIVLHFTLSAVTIYSLLKFLKTSYVAALAGGITFMLSDYLMSVHNLLSHLFPVTWTPLVIMFFLKFFETGRQKHIVMCSLFLSLQFLAGAPEILIISVFIMFILLFSIERFIEKDIDISKKIKACLLIFLIYFLVSAIQLMPFLELNFNSIRNKGLSYEEAVIWSFNWHDFIQFFIPNYFGYNLNNTKYWLNQSWLKTIYLGIMPFYLSILFFLNKDKKKWILLFFVFISFALAFGKNTWIYQYLFHVPPFNSIRYPVKFLYLFFFVIAMTTGFGLDILIKDVKEKSKRMKACIVIASFAGLLFALGWGAVEYFRDDIISLFDVYGIKPDKYNYIEKNVQNIRRFLLMSFLICTGLFVYLRFKKKEIFLYVLVGLLGLDLFTANYGYYKLARWDSYIKRDDIVDTISSNDGIGRYMLTPRTMEEFPSWPLDRMVVSPGYASLFELFSIDGQEVLRINNHDKMLKMIKNSPSLENAKRFFDITDVRYLISSYKITDNDFEIVNEMPVNEKNAYIYKYLGSPGRFLMFNKVICVNDSKAAEEKLIDNSVDLRSEIILIDKEKEKVKLEGEGLAGTARLLSYRANKVFIECNAKTDAFLYVSDTHYPGWRAYIDGKRTEIYRANLAFRAVKIPAGTHRVEFRYIPLSFYIGFVVTIFGVLLCIWLIKRDRKDKNANAC